MSPHLKPIGDRVLIEPVEEKTTTASGIVIPETAKEKPTQGRVLSVGPGTLDKEGHRQPPEVKPGERVLLSAYGGNEVEFEDRTFKLVHSDDILAIVSEPRA